MLGFLKRKPKARLRELREQFFAEAALADWRAAEGTPLSTDPWLGFGQARDALGRQQRDEAVRALQRVAQANDLESRQRMQAWHCLRALDVQPGEQEAKQVGGVVLDIHLPSGLDTLAAYADGSARYIRHGRRLIVWEQHDLELDVRIQDLLRACQQIARVIGPAEGKRPPPPGRGDARISILTPSGLHFGQGPVEALRDDAAAGPVIDGGRRLMLALLERADGEHRA
jgi:hypothetical protein